MFHWIFTILFLIDFFFLFISKFPSSNHDTIFFESIFSRVDTIFLYITTHHITISKKLFTNIYPKGKTFIQIESYEKLSISHTDISAVIFVFTLVQNFLKFN